MLDDSTIDTWLQLFKRVLRDMDAVEKLQNGLLERIFAYQGCGGDAGGKSQSETTTTWVSRTEMDRLECIGFMSQAAQVAMKLFLLWTSVPATKPLSSAAYAPWTLPVRRRRCRIDTWPNMFTV